MNAPQVGGTCRIGKGKALWEILAVNSAGVSLSKIDGDGYTNYLKKPEDITDVLPPAPGAPTLGAVLAAREALLTAVSNLRRRVQSHGRPADVENMLADLDRRNFQYMTCFEAFQERLKGMDF